MTVVIVAALGCAVGALLPRVIAAIPDREPEDGEIRTSHRVLAAAPRLTWWLAIVTGASWAVLAGALGPTPPLPAYLAVASAGAALAYVDLREHRLPDWLTYPAFAAAAVLLGVAALAMGTWGDYGRAWLGALVLVGSYVVLAMIRPGELGFGDVKLAAPLGMLLAWQGWGQVLLGTFVAFLLAGLVAMALLLSRRAGRRSEIPFGPFMLAGALVAVAWGTPLLDAYLGR